MNREWKYYEPFKTTRKELAATWRDMRRGQSFEIKRLLHKRIMGIKRELTAQLERGLFQAK